MTSVAAGSLRFEVEHRNPELAGGPTLRVRDSQSGHEMLRFDCFALQGHWHLDPGDRNEINRFPEGVDSLEWTIELLRGDFARFLARVLPGAAAPDAGELLRALERVEPALRNPPVDLDAVAPAQRRQSHGEKWTTYPEDVLPLWVADMDFPIAEPIRRMLGSAVARSDLGYPIHPAPTDVPELTVARMRDRFGWSPPASRVELLTEVVQGMYVALEQFSRPGDGVVVQTPIYPPLLGSVERTGRRLLEVPLTLTGDGYRADVSALHAAVDAGTRILMLCNPHNPTGRVFSREELMGIAALALERDLIVVSDEIHSDLVYSGHRHVPIASLGPEIEARTVTLTAASKAFNIAGLRCAVAIFGSDALALQFRALPRHLRGGIGLPGIEALQMAWRHAQPWLDDVLAYLESNRDFLVRRVREQLPGIRVHPPEATYLAWLDCRSLELPRSPYAFFLERARVALSNGPGFGKPGEGFVRINFATSRAILSEALERMAKALR